MFDYSRFTLGCVFAREVSLPSCYCVIDYMFNIFTALFSFAAEKSVSKLLLGVYRYSSSLIIFSKALLNVIRV